MTSVGQTRLVVMAACLWPVTTAPVRAEDPPAKVLGMGHGLPREPGDEPHRLESAWAVLEGPPDHRLLVVRHDRIVFERYAAGFDRHEASLHRLDGQGPRRAASA